MFGTKARDFDASMAIKNGKEEDVFTDSIKDDGIFHIFSPS